MRSRYRFDSGYDIYFITSTIVNWLPIFTTEKYQNLIIDSLKFYQLENRIKVHAYVIMENHIHLIVSGERLSQTMMLFKRYTAHEIIRLLKEDNNITILDKLKSYKKKHKKQSTYQVWQEGWHPKLITTDDMLEQKIDYIHHNPVRRGLVTNPEEWRFSSASNYILKDESLIKLDEI